MDDLNDEILEDDISYFYIGLENHTHFDNQCQHLQINPNHATPNTCNETY